MISEADEAEIEASRAPLLEHLIELRSRLIKSLIAFVLMFFACFFFSRDTPCVAQSRWRRALVWSVSFSSVYCAYAASAWARAVSCSSR